MKYISLFAGIGGFDLALNRCGMECVYANEWDKYAAQIYNKNLYVDSQENSRGAEKTTGNKETDREGLNRYERGRVDTQRGQSGEYSNNGKDKGNVGIDTRDIRTVTTEEIPDHDLLVGGFPCQAFSIAGKRRGFDDTRGTLFFEIARILKDKQPKYFILENVKGLLSHDGGNTFKTIIATLTDLRYDLQWQVLNSKNFGVPQNRERVFIIGNLRGEPRPKVFPIGETNDAANERFEQGNTPGEVAQTIRNRYGNGTGSHIEVVGTLETDGWEKRHEQTRRVHGIEGISPTIPTASGGGVMPKIAIPVLTPDRPEKRQNGRRFKEDGEPSFTLTSQDKHGVSDGVKIRRLTPLECERLQGFPDGWTESVSDTQRYKCLGNAVTVNVVEYIASQLSSLEKGTNNE